MWPPGPAFLLWLAAAAPAARGRRERGSRGEAFMASSPPALRASFGPMGTKICGMYTADLAVDGHKMSFCQHQKRRDLCSDFGKFCAGSLNMTRCEMPQIPSAFGTHHTAFEEWKAAAASEGVEITQETVTAEALSAYTPSQKFLDRCEVCHMVFEGERCFEHGPPTAETCKKEQGGCYCLWQTGISVTEDGHILDGHHRWAATRIMLADGTLPPETKAVVEDYRHVGGGDASAPETKTGVLEVVAMANQHPKLVKHTKCSAEELQE